uniref:Uncharacterized protein n=1 Tax=Glossina brevipalpis TaxID=37001 RepID=A0A1A9WZP6_9MUSC
MYGGCTETAIHAPFNTSTTVTSTANDIVNTANAVNGQNIGGIRTAIGGDNDQVQMAAANPSPTGLDQQQQQQPASSSTPLAAAHHSQHQQHPLHHQHLPHQQCNCYLPVLKPDVLLNTDRGLFKVYCFIKEFIGNKIFYFQNFCIPVTSSVRITCCRTVIIAISLYLCMERIYLSHYVCKTVYNKLVTAARRVPPWRNRLARSAVNRKKTETDFLFSISFALYDNSPIG